MNNQDWALARFREVAKKSFPALYSTCLWGNGTWVYLSVAGNEEWHRIYLEDGKMVGITQLGIAPLEMAFSEKDRMALNYRFKLVSPKQRTKIEELVKCLTKETATHPLPYPCMAN